MGNLRPSSFRIDKNVVSVTEKRSAKIFGKEIRPKVFGKWTKMPYNFEKTRGALSICHGKSGCSGGTTNGTVLPTGNFS